MAGPYRQVGIGETVPDAVTVGIERGADGAIKAAAWWAAVGDVDADEAEYGTVSEALAAAEAVRALHSLGEVVVALQEGVAWEADWGTLAGLERQKEPMGDISQANLSDDEAFELAAGLESESDA